MAEHQFDLEQFVKAEDLVPLKEPTFRNDTHQSGQPIEIRTDSLMMVKRSDSEGGSAYLSDYPRLIRENQNDPPSLALIIEMMTDEEWEAYADFLPDEPEDQSVQP